MGSNYPILYIVINIAAISERVLAAYKGINMNINELSTKQLRHCIRCSRMIRDISAGGITPTADNISQLTGIPKSTVGNQLAHVNKLTVVERIGVLTKGYSAMKKSRGSGTINLREWHKRCIRLLGAYTSVSLIDREGMKVEWEELLDNSDKLLGMDRVH